MRKTTLFGKLFLGTTVLIVLVLGICAWLIVIEVNRLLRAEQAENLRAQAIMVLTAVEGRMGRDRADDLNALVHRLAEGQRAARITIIAADGVVLADSEADAKQAESHADRPEVKLALATGHGESTRYSTTVAKNMKYVALRAGPADAPLGVVRVAMPLANLAQKTGAVARIVWLIVVLSLAAAIAFALGLARLWSTPLRRIAATARSLSRGDLTARARIGGGDELAVLARSLNEMRDHLAAHLATIDRQRRTLESLLEQLHEGVLLLGPDRRVLLMNPAAARMLGAGPAKGHGVTAWEGLPAECCVAQHDVQQLLLDEISAAIGDGKELVREVQVQGQGGTTLSLLAHVSDLVLPRDPANAADGKWRDSRIPGRLLVLTDVTDLARAAQVKADFASNASHELRTPLAAIRAAVETLAGLDLSKDAAAAKPFLDVIDRHSNRMEQMVFDLLNLSRIESSARQFKPEPIELAPLLDDVHARYAAAIEAKALTWTVQVQPGTETIHANRELLRLALDNLVDNAIKFTDPGGQVRVVSRRLESQDDGPSRIAVEVIDNGCGIPEAEQGRVFERFYQVERARSGSVRGTGLGLSIVRHAVAAMRGTVTLRSRVGEGTTVALAIPGSGGE